MALGEGLSPLRHAQHGIKCEIGSDTSLLKTSRSLSHPQAHVTRSNFLARVQWYMVMEAFTGCSAPCLTSLRVAFL